MGLVDHEGKVAVNYSLNDVFTAFNNGLIKLKGFKVVNADNTLWKFDLKAGVSAFSWGENLTVSLVELSDGRTEASVTSTPKTGIMFGGALDMGKNRKNINAIFSCLSEQLKNFKELTPKAANPISTENNDPVAKLEKLQQMIEKHLISQSEFDIKKQELLANL